VSFCDSWASCSTYTVRWLIIHIWTLLRICLLCMYEWQYASIYVSLCATYVDKESLFFFPFMPPPDQSGRRRHYVLRLSVRRSVHLSVRPSICLFVHLRSSCEHEWTDFDANWRKCSTRQLHETTMFEGHEVKDQGHTMPRRLVGPVAAVDASFSTPIGSSSFSSFSTNFCLLHNFLVCICFILSAELGE